MKEEKKPIGKQLAMARSEKKISLEKASKDTKITQKYLRFIEDEQFDKIPGDVVLKGFLRIYADYLNLDTNSLMAELAKKLKKKKKETIEKVEVKSPDKALEINFDLIKNCIIGACLAIAFIALIFFAVKYVPALFQAGDRPTIVLKPDIKNKMEITIHILDKTWLLVMSDGKSAFNGILDTGAEKNFSAKEKFLVKVGNAAGVKITSGRETLLNPGKTGQVVIKEIVK